MRKAIIAASALALLVVLYAAAGYWLAPRLVRDALVMQAARHGLELRLARVRTDPFTLQAVAEGIELLGADGRARAAAPRARAELAWASLWRRTWITRRLVVEDGAVAFPELRLERLSLAVQDLAQGGEPALYRLTGRIAGGGELSSEGSLSLQPLAAQGAVALAGVPLSSVWPQAHGQAGAQAAYVYNGKRLVLRDVSAEGRDVAVLGVELSQIALQSPELSWPLHGPVQVAGHAAVAPGGRLSARGTLAVEPLAADLRIEAQDVPLYPAQRWLSPHMALRIASGALSAHGRLRLGERAAYDGALAVRDARFEDRRPGGALLGWKLLQTGDASLRFSPFSAEVGELVVRAAQGRLAIDEAGRLNFPQAKGESAAPMRVSVRRLRIEDGTLDFADRSLENDFAVTVRELAGAITGLSTEAREPARVQLAGRVEKYGTARIRGSIDLQQPKSLTSIRATVRNLDLAALTPYVARFAGYRVESGRVAADLRYRVRDGRLVGQNQLTFEELQLGEKVRRPGVRELPLELAVALLADARGRISLDIPVSGNLNDPQFDFGGLVARALGNVIRNIASAPFRALAAALGKQGADLERVAFEPGSAELTPPAEESVAQIAAALAGRPQLGVTVQGGYEPQADVEALRRDGVRREIARRAGYAPKVPLDFSDPKVVRAAESLFLRRAGGPLELLRLRSEGRRYGRLLFERVAAATPVEPATAQTLAEARAETVRAALLGQGVDPQRVRVAPPAIEEAGKEGVPTLLSLDVERSAAAGASAR